jgi:hypothetical protein
MIRGEFFNSSINLLFGKIIFQNWQVNLLYEIGQIK